MFAPSQLEDISAAKPLPLEEAQALLGPVGQDKSPQTKIQVIGLTEFKAS